MKRTHDVVPDAPPAVQPWDLYLDELAVRAHRAAALVTDTGLRARVQAEAVKVMLDGTPLRRDRAAQRLLRALDAAARAGALPWTLVAAIRDLPLQEEWTVSVH